MILSSACFLALYDLLKKASVNGNEVLRVLLWATVFGSAAFTGAVAVTGNLPNVGVSFHEFCLVVVKALIVSSSWVFTYYALRSLPITIATPIRASAPAWTILAAAFIYDEIPTAVQAIGMIMTFAGYFAFSVAGKFEGIDFRRNRAVWLAVAGMLLSSTSALWDKFILQKCGIPKLAMQFWFQLDLVVFYGLLICAQKAYFAVKSSIGGKGRALAPASFKWRWSIPFVGITLAVADWFYFAGLAEPGVPVSIGSLMRRVSVAITFVLGAKFFHETNLRRKAFALALILAGIALLCCSK